MMGLIDNLSFLGFIIGIFYVIYRSVRYDDVDDGRKSRKFDIQAARKHQRQTGQGDKGSGAA